MTQHHLIDVDNVIYIIVYVLLTCHDHLVCPYLSVLCFNGSYVYALRGTLHTTTGEVGIGDNAFLFCFNALYACSRSGNELRLCIVNEGIIMMAAVDGKR